MGYGALWWPESNSRDAFVNASLVLGSTNHLAAATGIANVWARDPMAMIAAERTVGEAFPGRFVLGMGISHGPTVTARGATYDRPYTRMVEYLDAMDAVHSTAPEPQPPVPRLLAALGPRMLSLAGERTSGAHPYFVPVEHTTIARERMGPDAFIATEVTVVLETDPTRARDLARRFMGRYLGLYNYANNLRRLGWSDTDIADGGSDALVDAIVAWGDEGAIVARVEDHQDRGADHVCIQPLSDEEAPLDDLALLAAALLG